VAAWLGPRLADVIVADCRVIEQHYRRRGVKRIEMIAYGAEPPVERGTATLEQLGGLVIVGDAPYADAYKARLRALAAGDPRIRFAGYVFGPGYDELRAHAACYVQATEVGGTHPALLEAMAAGLPIIANDIPEHREVLAGTGWYYDWNSAASLSARLVEVLRGDPEARRARARAALDRVRSAYDWEQVASAYEDLAKRLVAR
jgi:glycosyltransferase involved in cell wall biosynthesis